MKIYLSGRITGNDNYREEFANACTRLMREGDSIISPAILPSGLEYEDHMDICLAMVRACDKIYMLHGWEFSTGSKLEREYAQAIGKEVVFEDIEILGDH